MIANLKGKVGEEKVEELIKEMKGEEEDMLGCVEMVWEEALNKGWEEGIREGRNKGMKEGKKERSIEIATNMKKSNISIELIQKATGLTKKTIREIKI